MEQAIAGVCPPELGEATSMIVWPTIATTRLGRLAGQLCAVGSESGRFLTLGKLLALPAVPLALTAFLWNLLPYVMRFYRLTNRRLVVHRGYTRAEERAVDLDGFDQIQITRLPGQAWLRAGQLRFTDQGREVFHLPGVSRPEVFREVVLKARQAYRAVRTCVGQPAAAEEAASS